MLVRKIDLNNPDQETLYYAARLIQGGGVVVFPSDSSYGLAADPYNRQAIERLFKIKDRPHEKQVSCIFQDIEQIGEWSELNKNTTRILQRNLPGPFTFILKARVAYPIDSPTVGVRIPDNSLTKALAHTLGSPYTATSANLANRPPTYSLDEIYLNFDAKIFQPDLILDAGKLPQYPPSAVIDLTTNRPTTIREGVARLR